MALCVAKRNAMRLYEAADVIDSDVGESIHLCLREAAVCDLVNACEEAFAARGNALLAAQDAAEIDIHVVLHPRIRVRVCCDLEHRYDGVACRCSAPRGEDDDVAARRNHRSNGGNVVARRIHDDRAAFRRSFGLRQNLDDRARASLADAAETLFVGSPDLPLSDAPRSPRRHG